MYYLVYGFLYLLSLLPLMFLYFISDVLYVLIYYIIGYRKKIVVKNLKIAFPQKSEKERITIAKKFYKNFCDTIVEMIKIVSVDQKFLKKHFTADYHVFNGLYETGKSAQVHLGHNFNWEMGNLSVPLSIKYNSLVVYMPLENKMFDKLFKKIRSRFTTHLISAINIKEDIKPYLSSQYILFLVADQKPPGPVKAHWIHFFGKPTPFLKGPEKAAIRNDLPVYFAHVKKHKRGYYHAHAELATMNPRSMAPGELTKQYVKFLERVMNEQPEIWLWSHNRWKWDWQPEYGEIIG
jgi:KDO2-lipid IV(A) lauroyltransferase